MDVVTAALVSSCFASRAQVKTQRTTLKLIFLYLDLEVSKPRKNTNPNRLGTDYEVVLRSIMVFCQNTALNPHR